jgi:Regulator of chromosome condensation (RCC1) repeat
VEVEPDPPPPSPDASVQPSPEPDANVPETAAPDAGEPPRLEVTCASDPCYVAVSGNGGRHFCGLLRDGTVRCWGRDSMYSEPPSPDGGVVPTDGALGRGTAVSVLEGATPAPVVGLEHVTQISVGPNLGTCARTEGGSVFCWGRNELGQLGQPPTEARLPLPTRVPDLPPVDFVALGSRTGCAIGTADRALYCWGRRDPVIGGATDAGEGAETFSPQLMPLFPPPVRSLAIGSSLDADTIVALLDGGVLATLGGQPVGESSVVPKSPLPLTLAGVARAGAFAYLDDDGRLQRWYPKIGELYVPSPATVVDVAISSATGQGGALLSSGRLFRWGPNTGGTLGSHPDTLALAEHPLEMKHVSGDRVVSFATTAGSTCASRVDGTVRCWGSNLRGELGRGTVDPIAHPESEVIR